MSTDTTTPTTVPPPPGAQGRRAGLPPLPRWLIALIVALLVVVLLGVAAFAWIAQQVGCSRAADPTRSGAVTEFCFPTNVPPFGGGQRAMTAGPDGNVWFTDNRAGKIGRITPTGAITEFAVPSPPSAAPYFMVVRGPDDNLWFNEDGKLGRMSTSGVVKEFALPAGSHSVDSLAVGPDGNLWLTTSTSPGQGEKLLKMSTGGQVSEVAIPDGMHIGGLAAGPDGNVWSLAVTSSGSGLGRITPSGDIKVFPITPGQSVAMDALTAGPDGNLWFIGDVLGRMTPAGEARIFTDAGMADVGAAIGPLGTRVIGAGPDGNLWFPMYGGRIGRITQGGGVTTFQLPHAGSGEVVALAAGQDGGMWYMYTPSGANPLGRIWGTRLGRITP